MIFRWLDRLRLRLYGKVSCWSICIEGDLTWYSGDDIHHRVRKLDHEIQVRLPFRPLCWLLKHNEYYGYCVYCEKVWKRGKTRGWKTY